MRLPFLSLKISQHIRHLKSTLINTLLFAMLLPACALAQSGQPSKFDLSQPFVTPVFINTNNHLPELADMQALSAQSRETKLPIMLMFGAQWCEFCHLLKDDALNPMVRGGLYQNKYVYMRHVGIDEPAPIKDWQGNLMIKDKWAYNINAELTPTVIFLNGNNQEVAPRIVGITAIELYAGLIHQNLNTAYKNMGNPLVIPATPERLYNAQLATQP